MKDSLSVYEACGERWELALDLLRRGGEGVALGSSGIVLLRDTVGRFATGVVSVMIATRHDPSRLTRQLAQAEVDAALAFLADLKQADPRLADLLDQYGELREYVDDYDTGNVLLATVLEDGSLAWQLESQPPQ